MIAALSLAGAATAGAGTLAETVAVHVQAKPSVRENVHIGFRSTGRLPEGGYYYAVIVLTPYKHYTRQAPPPCSTSSNMERTDYGYPQANHNLKLALTPAKSITGHWCPGGVYAGAIYAVPHPPPCESTYPCSTSESYERPGPCWETEHVRRVCGEVAPPKKYEYPDTPPEPRAIGTRTVGHFRVVFKTKHT